MSIWVGPLADQYLRPDEKIFDRNCRFNLRHSIEHDSDYFSSLFDDLGKDGNSFVIFGSSDF